MYLWLENVNSGGFEVCLREFLPFDGKHQGAVVVSEEKCSSNWWKKKKKKGKKKKEKKRKPDLVTLIRHQIILYHAIIS